MSLKDTLKFIDSIANKYLIDKTFVVGGLPRDIFMDIPNVKTTDIDLTTNSSEVLRLGILLAEELNVTFELSDDGHVTVFSEEFDLDFSSNFVSDGVVKHLNGANEGFEEAFSRDFTINALHQDLISGEITDPTGQGFEDMRSKLIRTPVPPEITLTDDPRRVYRAINLAARYDFDIAPEIKEFTISNPSLFSSGNVKDKYIAVKIGKALKANQDLTLKLLKDLGLFKNVPLSGYFKDILIEKKILVDYLGSPALDNKFAFLANNWNSYVSQGPEYKKLEEWWKANYNNISEQSSPSYNSWASWYSNKYKNEWNNIHKSPEETLSIMKNELSGSNWGVSSLIPPSLTEGFRERRNKLYNLIIPDRNLSSNRVPERASGYTSVSRGNVYTKPGVNINNVTQDVKDFIEAIGNKAKEMGVQTPIITSGWRSIRNQSALMGRNWNDNGGMNGGREYLEGLYGKSYGSKMSDIFESYGVGKDAQELGAKVIRSRTVGSHHITDPGQALDFSLTSGIKEVLSAMRIDNDFNIKIVDETKMAGPHYHVSILGRKNKLANINNRKERLIKLSGYQQ